MEKNEILSGILDNYTGTISSIEDLKFLINGTTNKEQVVETYDKIIEHDPSYIRKFLSENSMVVYQHDFIVDDKNKYVYTGKFNNDGSPIFFNTKKLLFLLTDTIHNTDNYDYRVEIFINGRLFTDNSKYLLYPSEKEYTWKSGTKRLFIDYSSVNNNDIISLVVKKSLRLPFYYKLIVADSIKENSWIVKKSEIGEYHNNLDNIAIYKKTFENNNKFMPISKGEYCISATETDGELIFTVFNNLNIGNEYLIVNKQKRLSAEYNISTDLTDIEYLENEPVMSLPLYSHDAKVGSFRMPIPATIAEELEILIDGLTLIPKKDYIIDKDINDGIIVKFNGILKPNSRVRISNKPFSIKYGYMHYKDRLPEDGLFQLSTFRVPLDIHYTDAYAGRRRVPTSQRSVVLDSLFQISDQKTRNNAYITSQIYYDEYTNSLLNEYLKTKSDVEKITELLGADIITQYKKTHTIKPNLNIMDNVYTDEEVYIGIISRLVVYTNGDIVIEGTDPELTVMGYSEGSNIGIDVTRYCEIKNFDKYKLGRQTVVVEYKFLDRIINTTVELEVVQKQLTDVTIRTGTNFFVIGDAIRSAVKVIATFEDSSTRDITDMCTVTAPTRATEIGPINIDISFTYNHETIKRSKSVFVISSSDRRIEHLDLISKRDVETQVVSLDIVALYNNGLRQVLNPAFCNLYVTDADNTENRTLIDPLNVTLELNKDHLIYIEVFGSELKETMVDINPSAQYVTLRILRNTLEYENRLLIFNEQIISLSPKFLCPPEYHSYRVKRVLSNSYITTGETLVKDEAIIFSPLTNEEYVIVDFMNENSVVIDAMIFKAVDIEYTMDVVEVPMTGNEIEGYTIDINYLNLGRELSSSIMAGARLFTSNKLNYVDVDVNNGDMFVDSGASGLLILNNHKTSNGSIVGVNNLYQAETAGYFELFIPTVDKKIKVLPNISTFTTANILESYVEITEDERKLVLEVDLPTNSYPVVYQARPNNKDIIRIANNGNDGYRITYPITSNNSILVGEEKYGTHIFYIENAAKTRVFKVSCLLARTEDNIVTITQVNGQDISLLDPPVK